MPSKKPRVMLTVDVETNDIFQKLADIQDMKKATLMSEYLSAISSHAEQMYLALDAVKDKKDPSKHLLNMLSDTFSHASDTLKEVSND